VKKYKAYWTFCQYSSSGVRVNVEDLDHSEWCDKNDKYTFIAEIELPEIDQKSVQEKAVADIDDQILNKNMELDKLRDKKQQLLALEYKENE